MSLASFERSGVLGASTLRNIEDNDQVARLRGQDIDASTPLWQHDKAWIRRPARLARAAWQSQFLSRLSFITSHYTYFIVVCLVSSLVFWGSSRAISYVDSLFLVVSAMTATGLVTVNLSQATTGQQVILFLLIIFGSRIWISICVVHSRKRRFHKRFQDIVREARSRRRRRSPSPPTIRRTPSPSPRPEVEATGSARNQEKDDELPYLSYTPSIGRNAPIASLTSEQRDELGGIEYRALKLLLVLLSLYFVLWQLLGCIALGAWNSNNKAALDNSSKPWWLGIFNGVSAFNNSGMSLLDASMVPFQRSYFVLITMGLMILAGHTALPILLRFIIWSQLKMMRRRGSYVVESLHFLLDHPRRVYIYLWPRSTTWWLLFMLILLNSINWVSFVLFSLGNPDIESIPAGPRVLDGLFQALSMRFGGFHITNISNLHIGLQVMYAITMSIPAHLIKTTSRRSRVYEDRSLAIFKLKDDQDRTWNESEYPITGQFRYFFRQMYRQSAKQDTWALMLAVLLITTIESGQFRRNPTHYSVFNIMFEVASAYGCVGVSVGLPDADFSFSGGWHAASKVILCAVMLRGRHRGLPEAIDQAVLLPSEALGRSSDRVADEEDHNVYMISPSASEALGRSSDRVADEEDHNVYMISPSASEALGRSSDRVADGEDQNVYMSSV